MYNAKNWLTFDLSARSNNWLKQLTGKRETITVQHLQLAIKNLKDGNNSYSSFEKNKKK